MNTADLNLASLSNDDLDALLDAEIAAARIEGLDTTPAIEALFTERSLRIAAGAPTYRARMTPAQVAHVHGAALLLEGGEAAHGRCVFGRSYVDGSAADLFLLADAVDSDGYLDDCTADDCAAAEITPPALWDLTVARTERCIAAAAAALRAI